MNLKSSSPENDPSGVEGAAEDLYTFLTGRSDGSQPAPGALPSEAPPSEEAALGAALQSAARAMHPDPAFRTQLEGRLRQQLQASSKSSRAPSLRERAPWRTRMSHHLSQFGRTLAWGALGVILVLFVAWSVQRLIPPALPAAPQPSTTQAPGLLPLQPSSTAPGMPALPPTPEPIPFTPSPSVTSVPLPPSSAAFPGLTLHLAAAFPASPGEVPLFEEQNQEPLTVENALAVARRLGIEGGIYQSPGESPAMTIYLVTDGYSQVRFLGSPWRFTYTSDMALTLDSHGSLPPFEELQAQAEAFLNAHNLLDFPYRAEAVPGSPSAVRFVPLVDGLTLRFSDFDAPQIEVELTPQGRVRWMMYNRQGLKNIFPFPIRSAEDAWQAFLGGAERGYELKISTFRSDRIETWQRQYPDGQRVEMYNYPITFPSVQPGQPPLVDFGGYSLEGKVSAFTQSFTPGDFVHAWGQFKTNPDGRRVFALEGWQPSAFEDKNLRGRLERQGDAAFLVTTEGEPARLRLPDAPAEVPEGVDLEVRGVAYTTPEATFDWSLIQTYLGEGGYGGPQSSAGQFASLRLEESAHAQGGTAAGGASEGTPTASSLYTYPIGQALEGVTVELRVEKHTRPAGVSLLNIAVFGMPTPEFPQGLDASLLPPFPADLENYNRLPVKVWGSITGYQDGRPTLSVERFEPLYPGAQFQAWAGTWEKATLDGKAAILFTAGAGQAYALEGPWNGDVGDFVGRPGDQVVVEGLALPDRTLGGYPVIITYGAWMDQGTDDPAIFQPHPVAPYEVDDSPAGGAPQPTGEVTIDGIELVYHAVDIKFGPMATGVPPIYIQPVWRFTGHTSDGAEVEILIQALREDYLQ